MNFKYSSYIGYFSQLFFFKTMHFLFMLMSFHLIFSCDYTLFSFISFSSLTALSLSSLSTSSCPQCVFRGQQSPRATSCTIVSLPSVGLLWPLCFHRRLRELREGGRGIGWRERERWQDYDKIQFLINNMINLNVYCTVQMKGMGNMKYTYDTIQRQWETKVQAEINAEMHMERILGKKQIKNNTVQSHNVNKQKIYNKK